MNGLELMNCFERFPFALDSWAEKRERTKGTLAFCFHVCESQLKISTLRLKGAQSENV